MVADAFDPAIVRDDAAAVAVNEAADELLARLLDEGLLPGLETDRPGVLPAGTVLWKEAWPVLGVERDDDASLRLWLDRCALPRHQCVDGVATLLDDPGVLNCSAMC